MTEQQALLVLNAVSGLGTRRTLLLIKEFGSATHILKAKPQDIHRISFLSEQVRLNLIHFPQQEFLEEEYKLIESKGCHIMTYLDKDYPMQLGQIADYPVVLYVLGKIPDPCDFSIAIVGSRNASIYGRNIAEMFAARLAELGIPIISGMARGIDTAAHQGALKAQGKTIAVLGSGLNYIHPKQNIALARNIQQQGAVISEFPMNMKPLPYNFPRRNRIVSALSFGVLVVEAALRSGALITGDFALEHGKEVYAIPGSINSDGTRGCHQLIKQGAKITTQVEDIMEDVIPYIKGCSKGGCHVTLSNSEYHNERLY